MGQIKTDTKSNEITAIPELLQLLAIKGCIVTIDAMGCQTAIAGQIRAQEGDYLLALKSNHKKAYKAIKQYFHAHVEHHLAWRTSQGDRILIPCNDVDRRLESDLITGS
jgi:predicted transposase YbfD/YdcC